MGYWDQPGASNEWFTPPEVFKALGCRFDLDVASPAEGGTHVPAASFLWADALLLPWSGFVWMNPPFGGRNAIEPWLDRFFEHDDGIALTPDRTSAPWFHRAWSRADAVLFTRKLRFIRPDGTRGVSPSNGTALWAAGERGIDALHRASEAGFGILALPMDFSASPAQVSDAKGVSEMYEKIVQLEPPVQRRCRSTVCVEAALIHPLPAPVPGGG